MGEGKKANSTSENGISEYRKRESRNFEKMNLEGSLRTKGRKRIQIMISGKIDTQCSSSNLSRRTPR